MTSNNTNTLATWFGTGSEPHPDLVPDVVPDVVRDDSPRRGGHTTPEPVPQTRIIHTARYQRALTYFSSLFSKYQPQELT